MLQRSAVRHFHFTRDAFRAIEADLELLRVFRCLDFDEDRTQAIGADVERCREAANGDDELSLLPAGGSRRGSIGTLFDPRPFDRVAAVIANVSVDRDSRLELDVDGAPRLLPFRPRKEALDVDSNGNLGGWEALNHESAVRIE